MFNKFIKATVFVLLLVPLSGQAQTFKLEMLSSTVPTNLRGLSPVDAQTVWVCGNNGHIGRTVDGGANWQWATPNTYEKSDFRDVYAFDAQTAIVMASGTPAIILRTTDGGSNWQEVFKSDDSAVFLDGIDFWDNERGICVGDWVNQKPYYLETVDQGKTWKLLEGFDNEGEEDMERIASFAASGTCIRTINVDSEQGILVAVATEKGKHGLLYFTKEFGFEDYDFFETPYTSTKASQGVFSLCVDTLEEVIWVAGGDYAQPSLGYSAYSGFDDGDFYLTTSQPSGYRSCIEQFMHNDVSMVISCGLNGADVSVSNPDNAQWKTISQVPLNTAITSKKGNTVFLCGPQGTIYKLIVE